MEEVNAGIALYNGQLPIVCELNGVRHARHIGRADVVAASRIPDSQGPVFPTCDDAPIVRRERDAEYRGGVAKAGITEASDCTIRKRCAFLGQWIRRHSRETHNERDGTPDPIRSQTAEHEGYSRTVLPRFPASV